MRPTVVSSGFRGSSIYSFNLDALDYGEVTNPATSKQNNHQLVHHKQTDSQTAHHVIAEDKIVPPTFTPEQETCRFAENYDIFDPQWLKIKHPLKHVEHQISDSQLDDFIQQVVNNQDLVYNQ